MLLGIATACGGEQPLNFVFMVADDLGWSDLGCYGSSFHETPALDRLAAEGVRFTSAYAACPVCSPTRASIFTGKYPARLGLTDHIGGPQPAHWRQNTPLRPAKYQQHLPLEEVTFAETLRSAGYATLFAGKWHLGHSDQHWPEYQGFDINAGGSVAGGPFSGNGYFSPYGNPRLTDGPPGEHLDGRLADETVRFIESHKHKPFLVVLSFYSVHVPLMAREDLRQKYERKRDPFGETPEPIYGFDGETRVRLLQEHAIYGAMVEAMDQAVAKVVEALKKQGLYDRTVIIFTSDNGGLSTGDRAISRDQGWPTSNIPLRMGKGWLYEGGIRVPLIIHAPGLMAGKVSHHQVVSTDFYPTILELASCEPMPEQHIDGQSFASILQGSHSDREPIYWHYPHYSNQGGAPGSAMRHGQWKLIHWFEDNRLELYNLNNDISEKKNVASDNPTVAENLKQQLDEWRFNIGARMPTDNPHAKQASTIGN